MDNPWSGGRAANGARLLSVRGQKSHVSSNLTHSASQARLDEPGLCVYCSPRKASRAMSMAFSLVPILR